MSGTQHAAGSPNAAGTLLGRALHAHRAGDLVNAQALYSMVLEVSPRDFGALYGLGVSLCQQGHHARGLPFLEQAASVEPDYAEAHSNLADALNALSRHAGAIVHGERAVALDPTCAEAYVNLGNALLACARYDEAIARFEQAVARNPTYAEAHSNLGEALSVLGRFDEAIRHHEQSLMLEPARAEAHNNFGSTLYALGRTDEALLHFAQARAIKPDLAEAEANLGLVMLSVGRYSEGWWPREARWRVKGVASVPDHHRPLWLGKEEVVGKTILLYAEQGLGDTIQFCRYASLVARKGAHVVLGVQRSLRALLADLEGTQNVVAPGDPLPDFDLHCPLLSLPLALGTNLETIPARVPYISARPDLVTRWGAELGPKVKLCIGIVWSGNSNNRYDRIRSMRLQRLLPLLTAGVTLVSLHHQVSSEDQEVLDRHPEIMHFGGALGEFTDLAALVTQLDLVISVDTAVAHLAGALGRPVWILLPFAPHWVWMLDRADSPWYPTAKLFRQPRIGDWDSVIRVVAERLKVLSGVSPLFESASQNTDNAPLPDGMKSTSSSLDRLS